MNAKRIVHLFIAAVMALPTFGGALQAQSGASCTGKAAFATGATAQTVDSGDMTRSYRQYVPSGYDPAQAPPLVISIHGFGSNALQQEGFSGWDRIAESESFIVVYPNGTGTPQRWNTGQQEISAEQASAFRGPLAQFLSGYFETDPVDDVGFIRDLIAHVSDELCIDPARIYVNGMSNGGGMTNRLACELSDEIAAAGMVAGAYTDFPGGCNPTRPVPVVAFHGVTDPIVPYEGSERIHFPAIETWVADWAARDQCDVTPETIAGTVGDVTGTRYTGCADHAEVDFYSISDGGHTWPGGLPLLPLLLGKTSQDIDASQTMWAFFRAHPMA